MALIQKARAGIAALTFAAAVAPFVLATPAKAVIISFRDGTETVSVTRNGERQDPDPNGSFGELFKTNAFRSEIPTATGGTGGIVFMEPGTNIISDVLIVTVGGTAGMVSVTFEFSSDPDLTIHSTTGFTRVDEDPKGDFVTVGMPPPSPFAPDFQFRDALGKVVALPSDFTVEVQSDVQAIPGPVVGAGLPGFLAACVSLFAWWRRRQRIA